MMFQAADLHAALSSLPKSFSNQLRKVLLISELLIHQISVSCLITD